MMENIRYEKTDISQYGENVFSEIGKKWMLICAYDKENERTNAMTASWGGLGILWNKPVCIVFVRPQRHTFKLLNESDTFSACFLPEKYRDALRLCGTKSGRDMDKLLESGLSDTDVGGVKAINDSDTVLVLKKIYTDELKKNGFIFPEELAHYKNDDFHTFYVCEIAGIYRKSK